jgi:hypothetical protein
MSVVIVKDYGFPAIASTLHRRMIDSGIVLDFTKLESSKLLIESFVEILERSILHFPYEWIAVLITRETKASTWHVIPFIAQSILFNIL